LEVICEKKLTFDRFGASRTNLHDLHIREFLASRSGTFDSAWHTTEEEEKDEEEFHTAARAEAHVPPLFEVEKPSEVTQSGQTSCRLTATEASLEVLNISCSPTYFRLVLIVARRYGRLA